MKDKAAEILKEAATLKIKKSKDYQGGMWSEKDYFPFGDTSYIHMMWTKMLRIRSVAEQENTNFESLEDSLLDMINYSAMYISYLRDCEQKGKDFDDKYAVKDSGELATPVKKSELYTFNGKGEKVYHHKNTPRENEMVNINLWEIQKNRT